MKKIDYELFKEYWNEWETLGYMIEVHPDWYVAFSDENNIAVVDKSILTRCEDIVYDECRGWIYSDGEDIPWIYNSIYKNGYFIIYEEEDLT